MKRTHLVLAALLAVGGGGLPRAAAAAENPMEFIHALQDKGYADIAADYLKELQASRHPPPELAVLYDFEMAKCLLTAARQAYNEKVKKDLTDEAKECLDRFIKQHRDHPKAQEAIVWWAGFATDDAMDHLRVAQDPKTDKETKAEEMAKTRAALEEAKPRLQQAAADFQQQLAALQHAHTRQDKKLKEDLEAQWQQASFKAILCDYYLAQTYDDPKDSARREMLEKAAKEFDAIFQIRRDSEMGVYAHMWQGKTVMELGDDMELAKDIFEEVLANFETGGGIVFTRESGALYAQVKQFWLELVAKDTENPEPMKEFVNQAREFHEAYRRTDRQMGTEFVRTAEGYQGVSMALAKALLAQAEHVGPQEKSKLKGEALKILEEMIKVPSSHQKEAGDLRRSLRGDVKAGEPSNFDEAFEQGYDALVHKNWEEAINSFNLAIRKATKKDAPRISGAKDNISLALLGMAHDQYNRGKLSECLKTLKTLTGDYHEAAGAPKGAVLAVDVKFYQYQQIRPNRAQERAEALQEVIAAAKYATDSWPAKPEADDARMILGKLYLADRKTDKALGQFEGVNPHSERYATALFLSGYAYWSLYQEEKQKPEGKRDRAALSVNMAKAVEAMAPSVELQTAAWKASAAAEMPQQLMDAQLMLAGIYLEVPDGKKAATQFQPLIDELRRRKPKTLDRTMLAIFLGSVRAYVLTNDLDKASVAGMTLVELGPDTEPVNDGLLRFAMLLERERKKAEAAVIAAVDPADTAAAKQRLEGMNEMLGKLLSKLALRAKVSPKGMVWIAETSSNVGLDGPAETQCQQFLNRVKEDPAFRKTAGLPAVTRIRTLLIHILGKTGKFEEAVAQVTSLIKEHPTALEPRMEECRLRYNWALKTPQQLVPAQMACEGLRNSLDRIKDKKPPEFFEVVYYEAYLLLTQAEQLDKAGKKVDAADAAKTAATLLKHSLFFNRKLDGPDRVEQYKKLLQQAGRLQGAPPASKVDAGGE
jgi:hypothetical protein